MTTRSHNPGRTGGDAGRVSAADSSETAAASPQPPLLPASLLSFQRSYLRGRAHDLRPVVQVGQRGVTDEVNKAVQQALLDHELIKVRLTRPEDKKASAVELAAANGAHLCGLVGHTVILYRRHPKKPRIVLPKRREDVP